MSQTTENILKAYQAQLAEDKKREEEEDFTMPDFDDTFANDFSKDVDAEEVAKRVKELENDPNDMANVYNKFKQEYPKITELELDEMGKTFVDDSVKIKVKHVYCPNCGEELISASPVMYNPFTLEKVAKHECKCGYKANFDYAYPRLIFEDKNGKEIKVFTD